MVVTCRDTRRESWETNNQRQLRSLTQIRFGLSRNPAWKSERTKAARLLHRPHRQLSCTAGGSPHTASSAALDECLPFLLGPARRENERALLVRTNERWKSNRDLHT